MWYYALITLVTILALKVLHWVWLEPKRKEKLLRKQGLDGNPYRLWYGDSKEIAAMYNKAYSTTLEMNDDIVPRVMPFIAKTVKKYGQNAITWIGPKPQVIISDIELFKHVMNTYQTYTKCFNENLLYVVRGLGSFEGEKWSHSRMKLNPAFYIDQLKENIPAMIECSENVLNLWRDKISMDGSVTVNVQGYLDDYNGSVVSTTLFDTPFDEEMRRNVYSIRKLMLMTDTAAKPFKIPGLWYLPTEKKRKTAAMANELQKSFSNVINKRLQKRRAGDVRGQDLLDLLLDDLYDENCSKNGISVTDVMDDAIGQVKLFILAGDTNTDLLVWTMIMLASHQEWQERAREEVLNVLGNDNPPNSDNLGQLKLISMILNEVLRLYPPVMEFTRVVEKDIELGEYRLPGGIHVQLPLAQMQRSKEIWGEDANEFRPDRFSEGTLKAAGGRVAFMPFGWGPRICIGQNYGLMQAKIFMAQTLRAFTFELHPTYKHAPYAGFTIQPQFGAPLILHPR